MQQKDYYEILGVSTNASSKTIKEAYRTLAFEYHPDRNKDNTVAAEKMKYINEAYAVLSNQNKRSEYDTLRDQFGASATGHYRQSHSEQDIFRGSDVHQVFEDMAKSFGFRGVDDIFKDFYGPGYRGFEFKQFKGNGWRGGRVTFGKNPYIFRKAFGSGFHNLSAKLLKQLYQSGTPKNGKDVHDTIVLKSDFALNGGPYPYYLKARSKKLVVKVPSGIKDGQQIRLSAMGHHGKNGGTPGDLYLKVSLKRSFFQQLKQIVLSLFMK